MEQIIDSPETIDPPGKAKPRILFVNRSYWPDGESTGQLLTELGEDLARRFDVSVVVGRPNANPSGEKYRVFRGQHRNGVRILRVPHLRLPKRFLLFRAMNFLTFLLAAAVRGLLVRRQDLVIVQTDPFLLAFLGRLLRWRHRSRLAIHLQDIHPDLGVAIGRLKENWLTHGLKKYLRQTYGRADRVIVPSGDMQRTLTRGGLPLAKCVTIPNWIDTRLFPPPDAMNGQAFRSRHGIDSSRLVVMYSGNLGATQQLEYLLQAAERLREQPEILFAFVGAGTAEKDLRTQARDQKLPNVRFFPYQPREELGESLAAGDLHVISVHPRALDYLMPSKLYGILAAGRPSLGILEAASELGELIVDERIGVVVPPHDADAITAAIETAIKSPHQLAEQGQRARRLAESEYDRNVVTSRFAQLIDELLDDRTDTISRPEILKIS